MSSLVVVLIAWFSLVAGFVIGTMWCALHRVDRYEDEIWPVKAGGKEEE